MVKRIKGIEWGILVLRIGLSLFLGWQAIDKILVPEENVKILSELYQLNFNANTVIAIGACQLSLTFFIFFAFFKTWSYGIGLFFQLAAAVLAYQHFFDPLGKSIFLSTPIPILTAFLALFLLREYDTRFTVARKRKIFS